MTNGRSASPAILGYTETNRTYGTIVRALRETMSSDPPFSGEVYIRQSKWGLKVSIGLCLG